MAPSRSHHHHTQQRSPAAAPTASIADSQLGLAPDEVATLRYHQHVALSQAANGGGGSSASTSRAASAASSQGRLLLDPSSLTALSHYFDRLLYSIQQRWAALHAQTTTAAQIQYDRAGNVVGDADAAIARFQEILRQVEEVQVEFQKIQRIGEIVKGFKARVEGLERRV